ncbi:hypothetical protein BVU17_17420 [Haloarcula taiwanensis]|uniref:Uncharacterized protein n=1 Tax=Haloarcula taiwanensis TaxID=1932004 RepID=A0A2H5A3L5_9EURY|nr:MULTISPECIES: hypothetical protein [Haloarcula]AUG49339.1 hypothetical protein BVU17_17420 [Haloarcula taiwanensis]RLM44121.1 hypothetical protein DVK00_13775 [Haloarcula sp. Atlit-47R]
MAVDNTRCESGCAATLPDVVPFNLDHLTRQSWELGTRSIQDEQTIELGDWSYQAGQWALSLFEVTSETAIIRIQTPVGRKRYYGAIQSEVRTAMQELEASPAWQKVV